MERMNRSVVQHPLKEGQGRIPAFRDLRPFRLWQQLTTIAYMHCGKESRHSCVRCCRHDSGMTIGPIVGAEPGVAFSQ
jgi:hypothetical protein